MNSNTNENIETAEIVLLCADFDATFQFFNEQLKFKIFSIFPADNPSVAVLFGYGLRIRLEKSDKEAELNQNIQINLNCNSIDETTELTAPNGVKLKFVQKDKPLVLPKLEPKLAVNKFSAESDWIKGRADMYYRDLIPERLNGYAIASHIHIPKGGIVPDYVHFHKVQFQIIYCKNGWAKIVYEDQGEPFIFKAGDCVLQPPEIRHRVLECSDNLEVIEVSSPAEHETFADNEMTLPSSTINLNPTFNKQKFVHHKAKNAPWKKSNNGDFEFQDTNIKDATNGFANVKVLCPTSNAELNFYQTEAGFKFLFVLNGKVSLKIADDSFEILKTNDSLVIPQNIGYKLSDCSEDFKVLEVSFL